MFGPCLTPFLVVVWALTSRPLISAVEQSGIYCFNFNSQDDSSRFRTSIPIKDIASVSILQGESLKSGYNFKIDLGQKIYLFNSK